MLIILEGADGCGKSTLSAKLAELFGLPVFHPGYPKTKEEVINKATYIRSINDHTIVDRVPWISDVVYNAALNRPNTIEFNDKISQFTSSSDVVIWCNPSTTDIKIVTGKSYKSEEYMSKVTEFSSRIRYEYEQFFSDYRGTLYNYDYNDEKSFNIIAEMIYNRLHE